MKKLYVQYGCGLSAPNKWINFDATPILRIQKIPIIGAIIKTKLKYTIPLNVRYGDIVKGLPIKEDSCCGVYCSHILEHLSLQDFRLALKNTQKILKVGGVFRCVMPDLESATKNYINSLNREDKSASIKFLKNIDLGIEKRPRGIGKILHDYFGKSKHLWLWDRLSLYEKLKNLNFTQIRICKFNDSEDEMFKYVEDISRFENAVAIECKK